MAVYLASGKHKTLQATSSISAIGNASPIQITTAAAHGLETGDIVQITGAPAASNANGQWVLTVIDTSNFTLNASRGACCPTTASGTSTHIGYATPAIATDSSLFPSGPTDFTMEWQLLSISSSNARGEFQDATEAAFATAQPGPSWSANSSTTLSTSYNAFPIRVASSGDTLRFLIYPEGGAGSACQFTALLTGGGL